MFSIILFDSMQFCNYCVARFIHSKHWNPLNIRNITPNVYLGAIIFPCLDMLICRIDWQSIKTKNKKIVDRRLQTTFLRLFLSEHLMILGNRWRRWWCDSFIQDAKQSIVWKEVSQVLNIALLQFKQNNPTQKYRPLNRRKTPTI